MNEEQGNLAIVSNNTFEASKAVNLHHYDISSALQTTLEFNELVNIFSSKIKALIPHSGFHYQNEEFELDIKQGITTRHSCTYALKVEEMRLGTLQFMNREKFTDNELKLIEVLLCSLIYPLRNATLFKRALQMAYTDSLTHTNNRTAFNDSLQREIQLARRTNNPLSVIFFDVDHFKKVNDTYGHECGDLALIAAANCIKNAVRSSDIVFRFGGEEFVVLLSNTDLNNATIIAERIRQTVATHTLAYGMNILKLTASLGIATLEKNDNTETLVKRADHAMYQAKENGRNRVETA